MSDQKVGTLLRCQRANMAKRALNGAGWECPLFFAHSIEQTILHNISKNKRNPLVRSEVMLFLRFFGLDTLVRPLKITEKVNSTKTNLDITILGKTNRLLTMNLSEK